MKVFNALFVVAIVIGCGKIDPILYDHDFIDGVGYKPETPKLITSNEVLERAYQLASVEWTPIKRIPYMDGIYYEPGQSVKGVPYSSVKEINTYLFQDVSYHTFMTAVHNPNSVLYTEDISRDPYHGLNCSAYYGTVCSSSVMYALGIDIPYYTHQIIKLPFMKSLDLQTIDSLRVCDVIWKPGHVQMIFSMDYKDGNLNRISTFESIGMSAHITSYSVSQFRKMWTSDGYIGYRYENIWYSDEPVNYTDFAPIVYNDDLCPTKGDKAVYRAEDNIVITIFNQDYDDIVLLKKGRVVTKEPYHGNTHRFCHLQPGVYSVYLQKGEAQSSSVSFETVATDVRYSVRKKDETVIVYFDNSTQADFVAVCTRNGESLYYPISTADRNKGYLVVPISGESENYLKVVFKGEYGSIINVPMRVK